MRQAEKKPGIILRRTPYRDNHLIVAILFPDAVIDAICYGAKKETSAFAGDISDVALLEFTVKEKYLSDIAVVTSTTMITDYSKVQSRHERALPAVYAFEIILALRNAVMRDARFLRMTTAYLDALLCVTNAEEAKQCALAFETKTLVLLGMEPQFTLCARCGAPLERAAFFSPTLHDGVHASCATEFERQLPFGEEHQRALRFVKTTPFKNASALSCEQKILREASKALRENIASIAATSLKSAAVMDELVQ